MTEVVRDECIVSISHNADVYNADVYNADVYLESAIVSDGVNKERLKKSNLAAKKEFKGVFGR